MNQSISKYLEQGIKAHTSGQWGRAETCYTKILSFKPEHFNALQLLGTLAAQRQDWIQAYRMLENAIHVYAKDALTHYNFATVLQRLNRSQDALLSFDQAIRLDPNMAMAHSNRAACLQDLQRWQESLKCYDLAIALDPSLVSAHTNRGLVQMELGACEAALLSLEQALELAPNDAEVENNIGLVYKRLYLLDQALIHYQRAILNDPEHVEAFSNLGNVYQKLNRLDEALASHQRAIVLEPHYFKAHCNLGTVLQQRSELDKALLSYDRAIELNPSQGEAHANKALLLLLMGNLREGFKEYEWRWFSEENIKNQALRTFAQPLWLGQTPLQGQSILIHCEQGLGDTLQFCRYIEWVAEMGARVIFEVQKPLFELMKQLTGVDQLVALGEPLPAFNWHCPLLSLPHALATELDSIPWRGPYLKPDPMKMKIWQTRLGPTQKPRVGLVWSGGFRANQPETWAVNERRNMDLKDMLAIVEPRFEFYSLQKGEPAQSQLQQMKAHTGNSIGIIDFVDEFKDFSDTAAFISQLDLIISVDTSTAHLAAAMGKEVWLLNRFDTCWRWLLERADSPWYPSLKVFRQSSAGDWAGVMDQVKNSLELQWRVQ